MNEIAMTLLAIGVALGAHRLPVGSSSPVGTGHGDGVAVASKDTAIKTSAPHPSSPISGRLAALHVYPQNISLTTARDSQSVIVQAEYADGITRDVTDKARFKVDHEN